MTDNDIPRYDLELVRSSASTDTITDAVPYQQPQVVYTQTPSSGINTTAIVIFAMLLGVLGLATIAYLHSHNCGRVQ